MKDNFEAQGSKPGLTVASNIHRLTGRQVPRGYSKAYQSKVKQRATELTSLDVDDFSHGGKELLEGITQKFKNELRIFPGRVLPLD